MYRRKTRFWAKVDDLWAARRPGFQSEAALARRLGVSAQTFATWKARGQFRRTLIPELRAVIGWPKDEAQAERYEVELIPDRRRADDGTRHPIETALRYAESGYRKSEATFARYAQHTLPLIRALGPRSYFTFSGCTTSPYEFENAPEGKKLAAELAAAVVRGAQLLYVRPTEAALAYYRAWQYGQLVRGPEIRSEYSLFRKRVEDALVAARSIEGPDGKSIRMTAASARQTAHERLGQCYIDRSPLWMPGVGLGLIGWSHARQLKSRATLSLPGKTFGGILVYPTDADLEFQIGQVLRGVVAAARTFLDARRDGESRDRRIELDESDLASPVIDHTKLFYKRLDLLLKTVSSAEPTPDALIQDRTDRPSGS